MHGPRPAQKAFDSPIWLYLHSNHSGVVDSAYRRVGDAGNMFVYASCEKDNLEPRWLYRSRVELGRGRPPPRRAALSKTLSEALPVEEPGGRVPVK